MNAVIYARYSSDKQTEDSIEAQVRACKEYAAKNNINVVSVYVDEAISGTTANRAQYQKMLRECGKGAFNIILIHKYDRIARNLGEHVNLEVKLKDKKVTLIAVAQDFGNSKEAKIMRALMWSLSEYYIDNLSAETKKGHKETAMKGLHNGGYPPFGYDVVNQTYVINELEAAYVKRMFNAVISREGFAGLIDEMQRAGIRGKRGKPIKYPQIYEILRNEKYTGVYTYTQEEEPDRENRRAKTNAIRIENALPIIISKAQFKEVQQIMKERKRAGRKANYLCSGLVYCKCGAKMHGMTSKRKGHEYQYFVCSQHCGAPVVRMDDVDEAAFQYLHTLLSEENQTRIAEALRRYQAGEGSRMTEFKKALAKRINEKEKQHQALLDNLSSGSLPKEVVNDIAERMQQIKEEISVLKTTEPPKDFTVEQICSWLEALKTAPDDKAVHLLISRIEVKEKTAFNITSTLKAVVRNNGCGSWVNILPKILFFFKCPPNTKP